MLRRPIQQFATNEAGAGTVMGLLWFALLVGFTGIAVDVTDGFRNRTMLQATADSAALAGAIDLPDQAVAAATTATYAVDNMGTGLNGSVLDPADVVAGLWDGATQSLDRTSLIPDAVMVTVRRAAANSNALPVNFLRIIGLQTWNVTAQAVAQRFIPTCLNDGLIARGVVDISSNNGFVNNICIHGQQGVDMRNHNFHEAGVIVSMPDVDNQLTIPAEGMTSNPGLPEALREQSLDPRMVNHTDEIMLDMIDPTSSIIPGYIHTDQPVIEVDEKFNLGSVQPHRIYHVICKPNQNAVIPSNSTIQHVVIIAECEININAGASVFNAVLGSRSGGNPGQGQGGGGASANIGVAANVQLGVPDNCTPGGGVQLFSNATIHTAATTSIDGLQVVAAGDVDLGARAMGVNGINVQAGGNITLTSNNMFGRCSSNAPNLQTVAYYRLVR